MEPWQQWLEMALESQQAALLLDEKEFWRASVSRHYYAAYQAMSAVLIYRGLLPPVGEEAWGHASTPDMIVEQMEPYARSKDVRQRYTQYLRALYEWCIQADYRGNVSLESQVGVARKYANTLIKFARDILPED